MKLSLVLTISAVYMGLIGLGFLLSPAAMSFGVVDATATPALIAMLRLQASTFIGIAVLNWMARNAEASKARDAIVLGSIVGFGLGVILLLWGALSGGPAAGWVFALINLLLAAAFFWTGRAGMSTGSKV